LQVEHEHARILREALSHIGNRSRGSMRDYVNSVLTVYGQAVKNYCDHPNQSLLWDQKVCLDCGLRSLTPLLTVVKGLNLEEKNE